MRNKLKLAIEVFLELEMMELIEGKIYRFKNFDKHQNIKVEEKAKSGAKEINVKNIELSAEAVVINEGCNEEEKKSYISDGEFVLGEGEKIVSSWTF